MPLTEAGYMSSVTLVEPGRVCSLLQLIHLMCSRATVCTAWYCQYDTTRRLEILTCCILFTGDDVARKSSVILSKRNRARRCNFAGRGPPLGSSSRIPSWIATPTVSAVAIRKGCVGTSLEVDGSEPSEGWWPGRWSPPPSAACRTGNPSRTAGTPHRCTRWLYAVAPGS